MFYNKKIMKSALRLTLYALLPTLAFSTTWAPVEKKCPFCGTKSEYYEIMSYGSYIYEYPSKYEYIFWPFIDGKLLYCCKKCWFTCYAWDFDSIPKGKRAEVKQVLDRLGVWETNGAYTVVPMYYRLKIAEEIYKLYDKNDEFWCHFYRIKGYHLAYEDKKEEAAQARRQALEIAERMLEDDNNAGIFKELCYITGAMKYLLGYTPDALQDFKRARQLVYQKAGMDKISQGNFDDFLNRLIDDYLEKFEIHE
jgi:hypothetical protein